MNHFTVHFRLDAHCPNLDKQEADKDLVSASSETFKINGLKIIHWLQGMIEFQ